MRFFVAQGHLGADGGWEADYPAMEFEAASMQAAVGFVEETVPEDAFGDCVRGVALRVWSADGVEQATYSLDSDPGHPWASTRSGWRREEPAR